MAVFVDVGAVRIQRYLARWPDLAGRRGASAMLAAATADDAVRRYVGRQADINPAAGAVDGVVNLVAADGVDPARLAGMVIAALRAACPAAELEATWAEGPTYVDAYPVFEAKRAAGDLVTGIPPIAEFPLARTCELCSIDPAAGTVDRPGGEAKLACADCLCRQEAAGRRTDPRFAQGLDTERRLLARFPGAHEVRDFEHLALLDPGRKKNHLATVSIDGNAMGAFFDDLRASGSGAKDAVSKGFTEACWEALLIATESVHTGADLCVVPHVLGGDDVLVSVPASLGFQFTCVFLRSFSRGMAAVVASRAPSLTPPTASAGIVIAHAKHPLATCARIAAGLLGRAKQEFGGCESSVMWIDVTREGETPPTGRRPWSLADLEARAGDLGDLSALPRSRQASFEAALGHEVPALALAAAHRLATRLDTPAVQAFLADGTPQLLRDALSIVRWWQ